ncbi:hypothetical protein BAE44_0012677 [Dichanthelium oligosanthes]|uniref:F-box domain-containing protein n=1 Tax=Dichanthelium oligosanthes TaxID=888268 RepID=A0A1E5VMF3_9POAL|nr:hypothetical protein BAE44_0012677 [Dichanthelium oligosanthes]
MAARVACGDCHRHHSACCRAGLLRRSTRIRRRADGTDYISALPDEMLLQVLTRLGCARAAAYTSLLSRRWRGLWTHLPELIFHRIGPEPLRAALAQVARPAGSLKILFPRHHRLSSAVILELLHAIASLAPAELHAYIWEDLSSRGNADTIELPRFERTTSITLEFDPRLPQWLKLLVPDEGFMALESLSLCSCHIDLGDLLPRLPRLCKLRIANWQFDSVTVYSPSLEELDLFTPVQLRRIDISAPVLKTLKFSASQSFDNGFTLTFSAPLLDNLSWKYNCQSTSDRFGVMWFMWTLILKSLGGMHCPPDNILFMCIAARDNLGDVARSFEQEISRIPVRNFSGLRLELSTKGHVYGAMVVKACSVNCPCDQPDNWRSQNISLTYLKEVYIKGFKGEEHEVGLLKVLLRCAAMLETVTITFSRNVPQSCSAYMELPGILKAHPSVKFKIYLCCGDQVLFG